MAALSNRQIARAAALVLLGFLASGALGLLRTAIFSIQFGTNEALDAFYAAQRIPEALYTLVAGGALGSSFIPVFARFFAAGDHDGAWRLASAVMTIAGIAAAALAIVLVLFAPQLVPVLLVPEASPEAQALTIRLTQIMMLTVIVFSVSGLLMGILNTRQLFTLPALALSMNNIGQIIGALFLSRLLAPEYAIYGLAWGAVFGAILHLAIQLPGLRQIDARLRFVIDVRTPGAREVLLLMLPRVFGLAITQINFIVNINLTSGMIDGSRTALVTAWTLMFFALGVIAQGIGTAVFPTLSALAAAGDMAGFRDRLAGALRSVLFLAIPASIAMIVLGAPLIALAFQYGAWTADSTAATAWALAFFAIGVTGHALLEVLSRAFYALSDTRTPVIIGVAAMIANIALSLIFVQFVGDDASLARGPFAGLALAISLTTLVEAGVLWWRLRRRIGGMEDASLLRMAARTAVAAAGMGAAAAGGLAVAEAALARLPNLPAAAAHAVRAIAGGGAAAVIFFGLAFVMRLDEARALPAMLLRRVRR